MKYAMLVYQAGIANVFEVDRIAILNRGRNAKRLLQSDFRTCVAFARGLGAAGVTVRTAACNQVGDIANCPWTYDLDSQPFAGELIDLNLN